MDSIDNLQPGDIVVFIGAKVASGPLDIMGLVVCEALSLNQEDVFIQFYGRDDGANGPVVYSRYELGNLLRHGDIRIQNAS